MAALLIVSILLFIYLLIYVCVLFYFIFCIYLYYYDTAKIRKLSQKELGLAMMIWHDVGDMLTCPKVCR